MYVGNMVLGEGHKGPSIPALHRSLGHRPIEKKSIFLFHQAGTELVEGDIKEGASIKYNYSKHIHVN